MVTGSKINIKYKEVSSIYSAWINIFQYSPEYSPAVHSPEHQQSHLQFLKLCAAELNQSLYPSSSQAASDPLLLLQSCHTTGWQPHPSLGNPGDACWICWEAKLTSVLQHHLKQVYNKAEGGNSRREKGFHKSRQQEIGHIKKGRNIRKGERWDKL